MADSLLQICRQRAVEERYNRKHIDVRIREEMQANDELMEKVAHGVQLLQEWLSKSYYNSKEARLAQVRTMDLESLVYDIFVGIAYCQTPELFTSVTVQLAGRLRFTDKKDAITTVAEIVSVLALTDAFDVTKEHRMASLMVQSRIPLSEELVKFVVESQYLPPMVCEPLELEGNYDSGYLTHRDSLILGGQMNHHDGDICLDVLNKLNKVALSLDTEFLSKIEEDPTSEFTAEKVMAKALKKGKVLTQVQAATEAQNQHQQWMRFKAQSYDFYRLMVELGNEFYLTHKVDKRGRIYAQGYHITTQGTAFKKAMIEFSHKEIVDGG